MHIDFLRLLFLVGVICPLMQEHSLRLKKLISQAPEDAMFKIRRLVYKWLFTSNRVLRADQKKRCKSNLSTVSVLANGMPWKDGPKCMFTTLSLLSPCHFFTLSPNREPVHRLSSAILGTKRCVPDKIQVVTFVSKIKGAISPGELARKNQVLCLAEVPTTASAK